MKISCPDVANSVSSVWLEFDSKADYQTKQDSSSFEQPSSHRSELRSFENQKLLSNSEDDSRINTLSANSKIGSSSKFFSKSREDSINQKLSTNSTVNFKFLNLPTNEKNTRKPRSIKNVPSLHDNLILAESENANRTLMLRWNAPETPTSDVLYYELRLRNDVSSPCTSMEKFLLDF
jgi:hypothetical protein